MKSLAFKHPHDTTFVIYRWRTFKLIWLQKILPEIGVDENPMVKMLVTTITVDVIHKTGNFC